MTGGKHKTGRYFCVLTVVVVLLGSVPAFGGQPLALGGIVTASESQAQEVLNQLKAGIDFAVLAKEKSIDPSANDGGYMGQLDPAQLRPEVQKALQGLAVGRLTGIVEIPAGFAIFKILHSPPKTQDLDAERIKSMVSRGVVRDTIDISGITSANAAFEMAAKPAGWNRDLNEVCAVRKNSYSSAVERLGRQLPQADAQAAGKIAPLNLLQGHAVLALLYVYSGEMEKSIAEWKKSYQIAQSSVPGSLAYVEEALGVTYLHLSEMENGVYHDPGEYGIFPPPENGLHFEKQANSKLAIEYFTNCLERRSTNLEVKWLLNLAYMTIGGYPSAVPPKYLVPLSTFASKENIGRFKDVAPAAGLNVFTGAGGVVVEDFDNDGLLDVVTSSMDMCEPLHFFHNNGDGTFSDRTEQAGLSNQLGGLNLIQGDYNNDGCMDLLVLRGGWEAANRKSLLRNNCNGTFTDVTDASGLGKTVTSTQTAVWADIDNDGYLDLFIGNENTPSQLFHNRGDGTFEDISHAAGIDKVAFSKGVAAADYDNDGFTDLYVSNVTGANFLYHNNHDKTFTEIGRQAGVQAPFFSFATWFFDYDNDGWPDLFVTCYFSSMEEVIRSYLGLPVATETLKLYRNLHNGAFEDVTARVGLDKVLMPMGANFGDVDNDGYLDMYLGMGQPSLASLMPHALLRNDEGKGFTDITESSGTGELHKGHGVVFADLARTGHEDILAGLGGAVPSDKHVMRVFENPGNDNDWINVRLTGVKSNRSAVGAQIKVTVEDDGRGARSIYRTVGGTSSFGGNPMEQHIGLGHGARITGLDIWWPASNSRQHFAGVGKNEYIAIKEFAKDWIKLDRKAYQLGGK
ncbi:MAG: FG-GAP-like repeat-containing protein [Bryobacteraceae bacterium]